MKTALSILLGLISAILLAILAALVVGGGTTATGWTVSLWAFLIGWTASTVFFANAQTLKRTAARACMCIGLESFALPVAGVIFAFVVSTGSLPKGGPHRTLAVMGAVLGGGAMTIILGLVGFFFGLCFIVAADFLREVGRPERPSGNADLAHAPREAERELPMKARL